MMNAKPQLGTQGALQLLAIQCIGSISIKYCISARFYLIFGSVNTKSTESKPNLRVPSWYSH